MNCRLLFILFFVSFSGLAQSDSDNWRHMVAMQFGGQTMFSFQYEYSFILKKNFVLNSNIGLGLNEHADDADPEDRPIYGIHTGLISLIKADWIALELGLYPTTYFYKSTTFVNLNAWTGLRISPENFDGIIIAVGYTPRLYYTYSDPNNHFFNATVGVKFGFNF